MEQASLLQHTRDFNQFFALANTDGHAPAAGK